MDHSDRLETLVTQYENTLFRAALAILGDVPEAEDAVQDAFLRYLEKRPALRDENHRRAWLLKVLANGKLTKKVTVKAAAFSESAKAKIEEAGGKAEVV